MLFWRENRTKAVGLLVRFCEIINVSWRVVVSWGTWSGFGREEEGEGNLLVWDCSQVVRGKGRSTGV